MKSLKYLFLVLILILLMAACTDKSLSPIFFTLETERSLDDDRGMPDNANVYNVVNAADTKYFAAANTVFVRDWGSSSATWTSIAPPESGSLCNTIEYFAGSSEVVAWYYRTSDGSSLGLHKRTAAETSWTAIADSNVSASDIEVTLLKESNGILFVGTESGGQYSLYYSSDAVTFIATGITSISEAILDIAYDSTANDYWLITLPGLPIPKFLYQDNDATLPDNFSNVTVAEGLSFSKPGGGLYYAAAPVSKLYLSAENGQIYIRPSGGSWSSWSGDPVEVDGDPVKFTKFTETGTGQLFVGSKGNGYFSFADSLDTSLAYTDFTRRPSYNLYELYNGAINAFFFDPPAANIIFAGTTGAGLWRADYVGGEWLWVQE